MGLDMLVALVLSITEMVQAASYCTVDRTLVGWSYQYSYKYCSNDCCGSSPAQYCCTKDDDDYRTEMILVIVGGVVGGIIFISLLVCGVCKAMKRQNRGGIIVQPNPTVALISNTNPGSSYGYQQTGGYQPPPGYQPTPDFQPKPGYQQLPPIIQPDSQQLSDTPSTSGNHSTENQAVDDNTLPPKKETG